MVDRHLGLFLLLVACGNGHPPPPKPVPASLPSQAGYCSRLQPLLDKTVRASGIGTEMSCLDVPGVTELGRFGPSNAAEEASLTDCFDSPSDYAGLVQSPEASFQISIQEAFEEDQRASVSASLTALLPWLPRLELASKHAGRLTAAVSIREARFVTLVGLASKIQNQSGERRCLEALCTPEYTYVHKALIGIPSVVLSATDELGKELAVSPLFASASFEQRELSRGSREIRSTKPVTLAIARGVFRTAQTERLCSFCGKRGQRCCASDLACDGGLGCVNDQCVQVGGKGQPCDGESCEAGAACVRGQCQVECGASGQPCCPGRDCSGKLRCSENPENSLEVSVFSEMTSVAGGWLGTSEDQAFGPTSCGALRRRSRFAVTKIGSGRGDCARVWWFEPKNEKDCRVGVHFEVSPFASTRCRIEAFATPPPKPDLCSL